MFDPRLAQSNNHYKAMYPKLREYPALDALPPDWLVFCWWYSCQASPLVVTPFKDNERIALALQKSGLYDTVKAGVADAKAGNLSDAVKAACAIFSKFNVDVHTEAYLMALDMYNGIKEAMKREHFEGEDGFDSEAYLKVTASASKLLPELVQQINQTYGIKEVDSSMLTLSGDAIAEAYFNSKQ